MRKVAVCIANENYADNRMDAYKYAKADAVALASALQPLGFLEHDQINMADSTATKTSIESRIRRTLAGLNEDDTLYFFYAGYQFVKNERTYLTCHDTILDDLEPTSIPVEWLFTQLRQCRVKKSILFMDSCECDVLTRSRSNSSEAMLAEKEFERFFESASYSACFASCQPGQKSYASEPRKHRIWTYHLIEALCGNASLALAGGHLLTSSILQNYFGNEIPRALRETLTGIGIQTPRFYGPNPNHVIIADLSPIMARRKAIATTHESQLQQISLVNVQVMPVRQLSGFQKSYRIPERINDTTAAFIARLATDELHADLQNFHERLRTAFKLKRKDIETRGPAGGGGSIITNYFDYEVRVTLNPEDPSEVYWHRQVLNIRKPELVLTDAFEEVYRGLFDTLEFNTDKTVSLLSIIDQIENLDDEMVSVTYDKDITHCTIRMKGTDSILRITPTLFSIVQPFGKPTKQLIEFFFEVQRLLSEKFLKVRLPFPDSASR